MNAAFSAMSPRMPVPQVSVGPLFYPEMLEHVGPGLRGEAGQGALAALGLRSQPGPLKETHSLFSVFSFTRGNKLKLS